MVGNLISCKKLDFTFSNQLDLDLQNLCTEKNVVKTLL